MHADHLIRMANQIGAFFEAMPDRAEALEGAARHLRSFWEPHMRQELLAQVEAGAGGEGAGLAPFMAEALRQHRALVAG
ncbi:formate dehydrogenase subunit delta [Piscinibacter sakaiensis]|uniref:NAD-dependent formate dehydrogenase, delta subunit n=1 Tax=Piscinibacter sakaiensis TaxID=1547922 RepID=A0A0K8P5F1_PISS1|nr:formate dehydrogenase subunit delta [Piscinibacter sakaiensis]GAP37435.1 NAD-dependent formate dehydrogenase, delta subunit [Piscinibacter sakaiensis]